MKSINWYYVILFVIVLGCKPKSLPTKFKIDSESVGLYLSHETSKNELDSISLVLKENDILMSYEGSVFFEEGKLRILKLFVQTPDHSGRTSADLVALQFRYIGFEYNKLSGELMIGEMQK
jgi:hypothetical protein